MSLTRRREGKALGMEASRTTIENNMEISQKKKKENIEIPFNLAVPLLGISLKDLESAYYNDTCIHGYSGTIHNSQAVGTA